MIAAILIVFILLLTCVAPPLRHAFAERVGTCQPLARITEYAVCGRFAQVAGRAEPCRCTARGLFTLRLSSHNDVTQQCRRKYRGSTVRSAGGSNGGRTLYPFTSTLAGYHV